MVSGIDLRQAMGKFATGVTLVTTLREDGSAKAMTANSVTSLSLDPPLVLVCLSHTCNTFPDVRRSGQYAINILGRAQNEAARFFAKDPEERTGDEPVKYSLNSRGHPMVEGCLAFLDCDVIAVHDHGDHTIFVGEVKETRVKSGEPLVFYEGKYGGVASAS